MRFPGLVAARPAGGPSLEQALNQLAAQKPGASGVPAPGGVFTGGDGLFYELETAARLQKVVWPNGGLGVPAGPELVRSLMRQAVSDRPVPPARP